MKINANFAVLVDVIEFEPFLGENIEAYIDAFDKWYFEDTIVFGIPTHQAKERHLKKFKYFNGEVIVAWMNEVAPECNARIVSENLKPGEEDSSLPYMYF